MNDAIKKAIEGGLVEGVKDYPWTFVGANKYWVIWKNANGTETPISTSIYLLDPSFWQCLGKSLVWTEKMQLVRTKDNGISANPRYSPEYYIGPGTNWINEWHRFINHLASGKDTDSFFKELLK